MSVAIHGKEQWLAGIDSEIAFWRDLIATKGGQWPDSFAKRFDPDFPLQDWVVKWLDPARPVARILDVGAGPLTILGKVWDGHRVEITAVDALADQYDELLRGAEPPPVRTVRCDTERLSDILPANHFDFAAARNTLDHSYDPMECIRQMCRVTRPGGHIGMRHFANEAETGCYEGLHQWNFSADGEDMAIWNKLERHSLRALVADLATIVEAPAADGRDVNVVLRRNPA
jgi:ubiquinone/menaquinone biosynthesis C-methylase UbiE